MKSHFWIFLILLIPCLWAYDFKADIVATSQSSGDTYFGTLIHYEDPVSSEVSERIYLNFTVPETILRQFNQPVNVSGLTFSSQAYQIGDWNPPTSQCCRHEPINKSYLKRYNSTDVIVGMVLDFTRQGQLWNLTITSISEEGQNLPTLGVEAVDEFDQVKEICPLYCSNQLDLLMIVDFSGSINAAEFTKFRQFVEKALNRFRIDNESAAIGLESFGGYQQNLVPDKYAFPTTSLNVTALWEQALTDPEWFKQIDWVNHGSNSGNYSVTPAFPQTDTGGYASVEVPILTDSTLVRSVAANLNNHRSEQNLGFTSIGTSLRLATEVFERTPVVRGVPKVLVVMTDGENNRGETINTAAQAVQLSGITTYALGVGDQINFGSLEIISGSPDRVFMVDTFEQIDNFLDVLVAETCQASGSSSSDTCQEQNPVINENPTGSITVTPDNGIVPEIVTVNTTAEDIDGEIVDITVDWGDGTIQSNASVSESHNYTAPGTYNITVTVTDDLGGQLNLTHPVILVPNQDPSCSMDVSPDTGIVPETVTLVYNTSDTDGMVVDVTIDWGDGTVESNLTSQGQEQHTYTTPGNYTITVTATDDKNGQQTMSEDIEIKPNQLPVVMATIIPTEGDAPLTVNVDASSSYDPDGVIVETIINWGDGNSLTSYNGTHTYTTPGTYTINITVTDDKGGTDTMTQDIEVNGLPTATVVITPNEGIAPENVTVNVTASDPDGTIANVTVDWGDGTVVTGSGGEEEHEYETPGTYNITVTVTDDDGGETQIVNTIVIHPNILPILSVSVNPVSGPAPLTVNVDSSSSSDPDGTIVETLVIWGDGTNDTETDSFVGSHEYPDGGDYTITVQITDDKGGVASQDFLIAVNEPPVVIAVVDPVTGIAPQIVTVNASASYDPDGTIDDIIINWGDGTSSTGPVATHEYEIPGNYNITVTAIDVDGDSGQETYEIAVNGNLLPTLVAVVTPASGISPLDVTVNTSASTDIDGSIVSTVINWGDGTSSTGQVATHTYTDGGDYNITIGIIDDKGGSDSGVFPIAVNEAPVVSMTVNPVFGIAPIPIEVDASGSIDPDGHIVSTVIEWGNGDSNDTDVATYVYTQDGTYDITVTVTDDEGASSSLTQSIRILPNELPVVFLDVTPQVGGAPLNVVADGSGTKDVDGTIVSAILDWGDGSPTENFTSLSGTHTYTSLGDFDVTLTVTDDKGGVTVQSETVSVNTNLGPTLNFKITPRGGVVPLDVKVDCTESTDPDGPITQLDVVWGDGTSDTFNGLIGTHTYNQTGNFRVDITIHDDKGLTDTGFQIIPVVEGVGPACEDPDGCEGPDPDDEIECKIYHGVEHCTAIRISGFCVNRFSNFAAFRYYNALNRTIEVPIGPNNRLTPGGNAPTTIFKPLTTEWFWVDWNGADLEWSVVDPLSEMHSIGRVNAETRPCIGDENPAALWAVGADQYCAGSTLSSIFF